MVNGTDSLPVAVNRDVPVSLVDSDGDAAQLAVVVRLAVSERVSVALLTVPVPVPESVAVPVGDWVSASVRETVREADIVLVGMGVTYKTAP